MSLGTITIDNVKTTRMGGQMIRFHFAGDNAYVAGGTPGFNALLQAAIKAKHAAAADKTVRGSEKVEVLAVVPQGAGVYVPQYDFAADKLWVYDNSTDAESVVADMSLTTFHALAICQ